MKIIVRVKAKIGSGEWENKFVEVENKLWENALREKKSYMSGRDWNNDASVNFALDCWVKDFENGRTPEGYKLNDRIITILEEKFNEKVLIDRGLERIKIIK